MATTRDYLAYLLDEVDISPANSKEELLAAESIQQIMDAHDVEAHIQEFDAPAWGGLVYRVLMIMLFVGVLFAGLQGTPLMFVGVVMTVGCLALFLARYLGNDLIGSLGPRVRSQNVVGVHRASGPLADKANRPIVVVAHYDTPRDNMLHLPQTAFVRPIIGRFSPIFVLAASVCSIFQALVFVPDTLRRAIWIVGLLVAFPLLTLGIASVQERFAACTDGANDNKSSIAALLGVLATICPGSDVADGYADAARAASPVGEAQVAGADEAAGSDGLAPHTARTASIERQEEIVGVRHGKDLLVELHILPESCEIVYREPRVLSLYTSSGEDRVPTGGDAADEDDAPNDAHPRSTVGGVAGRGASAVAGVTERGRALVGRLSSRFGRGGDEDASDEGAGGIAPGVTFSSEGDPSDSEASKRDDSGLGELGDAYDAPASRRNAPAPRPPRVNEHDWGTNNLAPERTGGFARRAVLFDLPDPSTRSNDPFATDPSRSPLTPRVASDAQEESATTAPLNTPTAPAPVQIPNDMPLLHPIDDDWKGGATNRRGLRIVGDDDNHEELREELREAVLGMDDDALVAHDVWFVALGASGLGHAGMGAFLDEYRSQIRGAFVINMSCIGAGTRTLLTSEGVDNSRRADRRLGRLVSTVASDLHVELDKRALDWDVSDATVAMRSSVRAISLVGMSDAGVPALSHTPDDVAENVDPAAVVDTVEVVCEVIRRS